MTAPLRLGVVGVGALSMRGILPHLTQPDIADRVTIAAVCDTDLARAQATADRFAIAGVYADLDEMLSQEDLDLVTLVTPIGLHAAQGLRVLGAGVHLHVNKTMSTTVAEADELIMEADKRGLHIVASPGEVLRPQLSAIRGLINDGAIGELAWAVCGCAFGSYHEDEPERNEGASAIDPSWYFRKPGGGPIYDMTVYALHQLTSVLGPAQRVTALSGQVLPTRTFGGREIAVDADDNTVLLLDFGGGRFAVAYGIAAAEGLAGDFAGAQFYGTRGSIVDLQLNGQPIEFEGRELTTSAPTSDWEMQMRVLPHVTGPHTDIAESHVFEDIMQLVRWIRDGVPSAATAEHARHVVDIIESGYRASTSGMTQTLSTTFQLPS